MTTSTRRATAALATGAVMAIGALAATPAAAIDTCIAPADPGGGWDFTCRSVGRLLTELGLEDGSVQVKNMPGGVGAVAFAHVADTLADDAGTITATSTVGATQIAQGKYPGDAGTMRWLAMLGTDVGVVLVPADSDFQSLDDLTSALQDDPGSLAVAGSSGVGGWDHIRLLKLAQAAGMEGNALTDIRWVQFDGGGPAVTQMMGGSVDAVTTDIGEIAGFIDSGDVRVLAVLSDEPLPDPYGDLPTAKSQGYDVTGYNWRGFYTGGDVSDEDYQGLVAELKKVYESDEWKRTAQKNGLVPLWRGGDGFESFVRDSIERTRGISQDIGVIQ